MKYILTNILIFNLLIFNSSFAQESYKIVGTGVTSCYNNSTTITCPTSSTATFYGQFPGVNIPAYQNNGNGTITDLNTGLMWQSNPEANGDNDGVMEKADKLTWIQIQAKIKAINTSKFGGYDDWRIPTIKELYSLTNWNGTDPSGLQGTSTTGLIPFLDKTYFPFSWGLTNEGERLIDSQYASSNLYNETDCMGSQLLFGFNFADGRIKGYGLTMPGGNSKTFSFIAVRGNVFYGINNFIDNGDNTVTDNATGLMWAKDDSQTGMNWQTALAFAQTKNAENFCGYNDWRLPNAKELQSIVDYTRSPGSTNSAAINPIFNCTSITNEAGNKDWGWYWTSTTHRSYNGTTYSGPSAVYVCFGRAAGWQKIGANSYYTYCDVHGAGAQRSDPKSGTNLGDYLGVDINGKAVYGRGPQGDILRINNYVRLVRTVNSANIKGNVKYDNSENTALSNVTVTLKDKEGNPYSSALTDNNGYYKFTNVPNGQYTMEATALKTAGGFDALDALIVNRYYLNTYTFSDLLKQGASDVNTDNKVDPIDALLINRRYIKLITSFSSGDWLFENFTINMNSVNINQNIKGICFGDVNGTFKP